jgi:hypothetical protein
MLSHAYKERGWGKSFKQINLPSFGAAFCENFWKTKLYVILLLLPGRNGIDGSVYKWLRPSGSCSECAWLGSCTQVFGGDRRPGEWDLPSTVEVASSTATCHYGLWLSLVLTGNPYLRTAIGEGLSLPKLRAAWSGIGGCYGKASSQFSPSRAPKCVTTNGVGCVRWGTCTTSAEGLT